MARVLFLTFFLCLSCLLAAVDITFNVSHSSSKLYIAVYYGKGVQLVDSVVVHDGVAVWHTDEVLPQGVYFLSGESNGPRFDFLLGEDQDFVVKLNSLVSSKASILGADESSAFCDYQQLVSSSDVSDEQKLAYTKSVSANAAEGSLLKLIFKAMLPPSEKQESMLVVVEDEDYRALHFWDNYDLSDVRLAQTPFFAQRVDVFLRNVLPPREDKIVAGSLSLLSRVDENLPLLKIIASSALAFSNENTIMGIDALGYEVVQRYYLSGRFGDLPTEQRLMLEDYVQHLEYCRVGQQGKNIVLSALDSQLGQVSLYDTQASYTLLVFWEPDCDYCKVVIPLLQKDIAKKYFDKGLRVFAVNTQDDYDMWKDYIIEHELFDWFHGIASMGDSDFMTDYGIQGTPYIYLLDKNKQIIAKNVKLEHLDMMLSRLYASGTIY